VSGKPGLYGLHAQGERFHVHLLKSARCSLLRAAGRSEDTVFEASQHVDRDVFTLFCPIKETGVAKLSAGIGHAPQQNATAPNRSSTRKTCCLLRS
jgi:hypothetical protein